MKLFYALVLTILLPFALSAQLVVDDSASPEDVIQEAFLANGIFTSNIVYTGFTGSVGTFDGSLSNLGLSTGIVMGSGAAIGAVGPNDMGSNTEGGGNFNGDTDPDLVAALGNITIYDLCMLEFDFIATGDSMDFQYVFGSEEYSEFVGSAFNDGFAFFLSGPGISGPYSNDAVNIAQIPGSDLPVAINNLNNGSSNNGPCQNCEFYIHNGDGVSEPYASDPTYIQCDGFTTVLHAGIGNLQVGEVYHIKLAIADAMDASFDSYVFLAGSSFVQFCNDEVNILPTECMLSTLGGHISYTTVCNTIEVANTAELGIEYTNCYLDFGDGVIVDNCEGITSHEFDSDGIYEVELVYEVGDFESRFSVGSAIISSALPSTPGIILTGDQMNVSGWNGLDLIQWYFNGEAIEGAESITWQLDELGTYTVEFTNSCGSVLSDPLVITSILETNEAQFSIYPNPSSGELNVQTGIERAQLTLLNQVGQVVYQSLCNGMINLDLDLQQGIYFMQLRDLNRPEIVLTERLIIE